MTPGPGKYSPKVNISLDGTYILSTYKNSVTRKFGSPSTVNLSQTGRKS